jgi:ethanolamine ammonia-lyase small subunit
VRQREVLERAVQAVAEHAANADAVVDEAHAAGLDASHPLTVQAKMLRHELLLVKADLERELAGWVLDCSACGQTVHWVAGLGISPGHWGHREPAPHGEPVVL